MKRNPIYAAETLQLIIRQSLEGSKDICYYTLFDLIFGLSEYPDISGLEMKKMLCEYHNDYKNDGDDDICLGRPMILSGENNNIVKNDYVRDIIWLCGIDKDGELYAFNNMKQAPFSQTKNCHSGLINHGVEKRHKLSDGTEWFLEQV